jgi:hypothetical protein
VQRLLSEPWLYGGHMPFVYCQDGFLHCRQHPSVLLKCPSCTAYMSFLYCLNALCLVLPPRWHIAPGYTQYRCAPPLCLHVAAPVVWGHPCLSPACCCCHRWHMGGCSPAAATAGATQQGAKGAVNKLGAQQVLSDKQSLPSQRSAGSSGIVRVVIPLLSATLR